MPGAANVTLRWVRPNPPPPIAAGVGAATAAGLPAAVTGGGVSAGPVLLTPPTVETWRTA